MEQAVLKRDVSGKNFTLKEGKKVFIAQKGQYTSMVRLTKKAKIEYPVTNSALKILDTMTGEVDSHLTRVIYPAIGIDRPENHDKIVKFIVSDVKETADPDNWHSGDIEIGFRRFLESK